MANELAIPNSAPVTTASTPAVPAETGEGGDFVAALEKVLTGEASATTSATPLVQAVSQDDESGDLQDLLDAGAIAVDPQALMLALEQAQRIDVSVQSTSQDLTRAVGTQSNRAILAALTAAGSALSLSGQEGAAAGIGLDTSAQARAFEELLGAKSEAKGGTDNAAAMLVNNAALQERVADLNDKPVIRAHVGSSTWTQELAGKLTVMVGKGMQSASLQLSPEHLGPLEVRISVQNEQASIWFGAAHADTRAALEQALPRLREMLAGQGLNLSDAGVFREAPRQPNKQYSGGGPSPAEGEREFRVAVGIRGIVDAYA